MSKILHIVIENTFSASKATCNENLKAIREEYPDRTWIVKPAVLIKEVERKIIDGHCVFEVIED